ncbi:MAG: Lead, cadmium, zinc and mercury transporting ATPase [Armatimonadetes bacterium]|jgi:Zn-dependent protease/CBS domain-containing protein|nr:Lead, cadmium, zinc and mercury transporting ATPase [Armatimonadota bacterium]
MGGSLRLGSLLGFEIRLDLSWFLVVGLMTWSLATGVFPPVYHFDARTSWVLGALAALLLFASVVVHELSHAVVARAHGLEVSGITLFLFGGVAQLKDEPPTPRAELLIAGVGPVASLFLGAACLGVSFAIPADGVLRPIAALANYLGIVNIALAAFNLIPGFPLDGGRLLRSAIWHFSGNLHRATRWASQSGQVFAWLLIGYGAFRALVARDPGGFWLMFVGWFLNGAAQSAYQQLVLRSTLSGVPVTEVMTHEVPEIDAEIRVPEFVHNYLLRHEYSVYPVTREGEFVGVIGLADVRRLERDVWGVTCVGALAHEPDEDRVLHHDQDAWDALTQMVENDSPRLLVIENGKLEGIVSREAIIRLVQIRSRLGMAQ